MINGQTKLDTAKSMEKDKFNDFLDWKQGCALRKIEGSPVLWSCEIQGAQHNYDFYEKRFSCHLEAKVRCQGQPGD